MASPYRGPVFDVYAGGHCVSVTIGHRFAVREQRSRKTEPSVSILPAEGLSCGMELPVPRSDDDQESGLDCDWVPIECLRRRQYSGPVYSLSVKPSPYFIANGIVTHNSIYGWRGADVKIIRGFKEAYPDAKVVKLEQNYRSTKRIVSAAHTVIVKGKDRLDKALWTANPAGPKVVVIEGADEYDEARFVGEQIRRLLKAEHSPEQMAVLYRSHVLSRAIEDELINSRIAYRIVGGFGFYDRKEVKGILSYLRLVVNPDSDVDTVRVINMPHRGIGAGTVKRLRELGRSRKTSMWGAMPTVGQLAEVRPRERDAIVGFRQRMERLQALSTDVHRPSEFAARLVHDTGLKRMWLEEETEKLAAGKKQQADEAHERAENCDSLIEAIASYERKCTDLSETPSLRGYLEMVALATKDKEATERQAEKVTLMTVHAAKGLEFDYVWLVAMEEDRFPSGRVANEAQAEEERRLAYVAITRARRQLWLTMASQRMVYGSLKKCQPSRFAEDLVGAEDAVEYMSTSEYRELQRQALGEI
jgi:DNA helicase-2/ATP-dependent DNA helicase PcrA